MAERLKHSFERLKPGGDRLVGGFVSVRAFMPGEGPGDVDGTTYDTETGLWVCWYVRGNVLEITLSPTSVRNASITSPVKASFPYKVAIGDSFQEVNEHILKYLDGITTNS